ncbi:endonuclease 2 [Olea europaea subsp. europaea]|uniref:Aspergillus nuclease S1 n=1 Tax=Olea europaea subsp. europaea TaxID=158383 RepID=A0A8S0TVS5_OLEEU|nr:endonuclease 2 [Olea europaea subsp. europaea]
MDTVSLLRTMQVWDNSIIETEVERFYDSNVNEMIDAIQKNIMVPHFLLHCFASYADLSSSPDAWQTIWAEQEKAWEACRKTSGQDIYASDDIKAACGWAYKGASEDSVLEDDYFLIRSPMVNLRLAQVEVRLAATLTAYLNDKYFSYSLK